MPKSKCNSVELSGFVSLRVKFIFLKNSLDKKSGKKIARLTIEKCKSITLDFLDHPYISHGKNHLNFLYTNPL